MPRREMTCRQRGRHRSETDHGRVASAASHSTPGAVLGARGRASGSDSRRTSRVSTGRSCRPASPAGRSTPNSSTTCPRGSIPAARTASTTRSSTPGRSSSVPYRSAWARSSAATPAISPTCCRATSTYRVRTRWSHGERQGAAKLRSPHSPLKIASSARSSGLGDRFGGGEPEADKSLTHSAQPCLRPTPPGPLRQTPQFGSNLQGGFLTGASERAVFRGASE
jgi:hypothetical protein